MAGLTRYLHSGRATREEENSQGPGEEENNIHPPVRQCHHDRRQEEGMGTSHFRIILRPCPVQVLMVLS